MSTGIDWGQTATTDNNQDLVTTEQGNTLDFSASKSVGVSNGASMFSASKEAGNIPQNLIIKANWKSKPESPTDFDISVTLHGADGKPFIAPSQDGTGVKQTTIDGETRTVPECMAYYHNLNQSGITHYGDDRGDSTALTGTEQIDVAFAELSADSRIAKATVCLTTHDDNNANAHPINGAEQLSILVIDGDTNKVVSTVDLTANELAGSTHTGMTLVSIKVSESGLEVVQDIQGLGHSPQGLNNVFAYMGLN